MNGRRYYIISGRGELGPFTAEELVAAFKQNQVQALDQVRYALGTPLGSVARVVHDLTAIPAALPATDAPREWKVYSILWLVISGVLFLASAVLYAVRGRRVAV